MNLQIINPSLVSQNQALSKYDDFMDRVRAWLTTWGESRDVKPQTRRIYYLGIRRFLDFCDLKGVHVPTRSDLIEFKETLIEEGIRPNTINLYITANRLFWRSVSIEAGYPGLDIGNGVKGLREAPGHRRDAFTLDQINQIRESVDRSDLRGLRNFAIIDLMSHLALRTVEICRLRIEDLRQKNGRDVLYIFGKGCDSASQMLILKKEVKESIDAYLRERFKGKKIDISLPLFISHSRSGKGSGGGNLTPEMIRVLFRSQMEKVGIVNNRLSCHSVRHFCATHLIDQGVDILRTKTLLRHSSIETTMIYVHQHGRFENPPEDFITLSAC